MPNEYDQYAIYFAIMYHAAIDMFSAAVPYFLPLVKYQLSYTRIHACGRKFHTSER